MNEVNPLVEAFKALVDRAPARAESRCIAPPVGCGRPIDGFRDALSRREYQISGWCQACQDKVFADPDEEPQEHHSVLELPLQGQMLALVDFTSTRNHGGSSYSSDLPELGVDVNRANLITSLVERQPLSGENLHRPVLDVDLPVHCQDTGSGEVVLLLGVAMTQTDAESLAVVLRRAGIDLRGYAALAQGLTLILGNHAAVVESSTPGKHHLYVDVVLKWSDYAAVLDEMARVGVLEAGYVSASRYRKYTALRLPWVRK